ncbi:transposase, partial [Mycobacterium tuberculosis BTB11-207]
TASAFFAAELDRPAR